MNKQIENLVRYMSANPAEDMTIFNNEVLDRNGEKIAAFQNHGMALKAVQTVRAEIDKHLMRGAA